MSQKWGALCLILAGTWMPRSTLAQKVCPDGLRIEGTVVDPSGAVIPGAQVQTASGEKAISDATGKYLLPCVAGTSAVVHASAQGFATGNAHDSGAMGTTVHVNLELPIASVEEDVQVSGDTAADNGGGAATTVFNAQQVQQLPDDPDDLLSELQMLASSSGGDPSATTIVVDGFQNASAMPPKSSIASIRINPDFFAPEYQTPAWHGGRVEITTKPGADKFHGALFLTNSNGIFNATDAFSTTATPAGKQRYGFELSGPIMPRKLDFALALEHRGIDEFNVVNSTVLDSTGNNEPLRQAVTAPQRLWIGSARGDWQANKSDIATLSWSANANDQGNQGVGGLVLQEAGYSSRASGYDLRLTNALTLSPNTLHETRIGYSWKRTLQTPNSSAPSLEVAGYFTGGGATSQNLNDRERDLEVGDDLLATRGKHEFNLGFQSITSFVHDYNPNTFNGAYVFGGGSAPILDASNNPTARQRRSAGSSSIAGHS
jgi:hypothetical protein